MRRLLLKNSRGFWEGAPQTGFIASATRVPALAGSTMFLFLVDIHTGNVISTQFRWVNDFVTLLAVLLVLSGPILWWRQKWR